MLKILLADADRLFLELAKTFLRKTGVEVLSCMNGNELLELMRDKNPDLVFLSTNMPSRNGLECFHSIKQDEDLRSITIVMTSSTGKGEEFDKCLKAGADELLVKPINRHTFMATVNKFLDLEKRYNSRFGARFPVFFGFTASDLFTGNSINLSTSGQFVGTESVMPIDTELVVKFQLPGTNTYVQCKAVVAWVNKPGAMVRLTLPQGMGLKFLNLTRENESAISEYLRKELITPLL
jgi:uncharacterized protein (TIGR02266 family)